MRDHADNVVVVCSIENLDPMGVHTGDSITVAPALTLTDREYQRLRDIGIAVIREVGVDTGGCNIQFAVNPVDGRVIVIEMNPRVSRSSALASRPPASRSRRSRPGWPSATPRRGTRTITEQTPASFEPTLDYRRPRCPGSAFEVPQADPTLTTTMKSVGEAMSIGRSFTEALQKALRSMERSGSSFHWLPTSQTAQALTQSRRPPTAGSSRSAGAAARRHRRAGPRATGIDPWFLDQIRRINAIAAELTSAPQLGPAQLRLAKRHGFGRPARPAAGMPEAVVRGVRTPSASARSTRPWTPAPPSSPRGRHTTTRPTTRETEVSPREAGRAHPRQRAEPDRAGRRVRLLVRPCASFALRDAGYDTVMVNCNPETVSTDYDTSSRLYFEPLTLEDVLEVYHAECQAGPVAGVIVQLGGQTPLGFLPAALRPRGCPSSEPARDPRLAGDRGAFGHVLAKAHLPAPQHGTAFSIDEALDVAHRIGYPVLVRPSHVLGGRGMVIVYDDDSLRTYVEGHRRQPGAPDPRRPLPRRRDRDRHRRALRR